MNQLLKIALLALLMWSVNQAFGKEVAFTPNRGGGRIVITDDSCIVNNHNYGFARHAYNYDKDNNTRDGCWWYENGSIVIIWEEIPYYNIPATKSRYNSNTFYKPDGNY